MDKARIVAIIDQFIRFAEVGAQLSFVPWDDTVVRMFKHFRNDEAFQRLIDRLVGNATPAEIRQRSFADDPEFNQFIQRYETEVPQTAASTAAGASGDGAPAVAEARFDGSRIRQWLPLILEVLAILRDSGIIGGIPGGGAQPAPGGNPGTPATPGT